MLISPRSTFSSCGSSSMREQRMMRPIGVTRGSWRAGVAPKITLDTAPRGLARESGSHPEGSPEVGMILPTPFCPYAGTLVQQAKDVTRRVVDGEVIITLLDEPRWTPDMMEGGDWSEWGLV